MIPETLDDWTLDIIRSLLQQGIHENERLEFKEMLPTGNDQKGKLRLRKAVAAFANSGGGFLVIGVRDARDLLPEARMVGRPDTEEILVHFGSLASGCEPSIDWRFANPPLRLPTGNAIHVIHVEASRRGPHWILDDDKVYFPKRTNSGTEPMSYSELRVAFVDQQRRDVARARLRSELERVRDFAERQNQESYRCKHGFVPESLFIERYRPQWIEAVVHQFIDDLGANGDVYIRQMRDLVGAAHAADEISQQLASMLQFVSDPGEIDRRFEVPLNYLRSYARKVEAISKWALKELAPATKA
jgi:schlafen family protein